MREPFRHQPHTRAQGRVGEEEAVLWLRRQGYRIVDRNVATKAGEIDLVAEEGETLCFVEVKARANRAYGPAIAAISRRKMRRLSRAAALYLARRPADRPCRFDVLAMDLSDDGWAFQLVRDAFPARFCGGRRR
ncbi:MAG: YraN family protein [Acidobacteria bacterium]|nr:MAG: YraN family protein [Acidobacteriota bacterium]